MNNSTIIRNQFVNEPVLTYEQGSRERIKLEKELDKMKNSFMEIPVVIGGKEILTGNKGKCIIPHNNKKVIGEYHKAGKEEAFLAAEAALKAKEMWAHMQWQSRAAIFLKAAELAAGPWRARLNASTMLTQSKTYKQAEIDSACELIDFLRNNVACLNDIYMEQPLSSEGILNKIDYRPLEGFVFAVSPFNFTAIAANLPSAAAVAGNTVVWKPASNTVYSSYVVYQLLKEAGMPEGVINFIPGNAQEISDVIISSPQLSGIHFTGSTQVFLNMWKTVGNNIENYKTFPRIVGETGGKNYVIVHKSANLESAARGLVEGTFEYQGQKCSAASRAYIAKSVWPELKKLLLDKSAKIKVGDIEEADTFMGAVIDLKSYCNIKEYIDYIKNSEDAKIIFGGKCDDSVGYFVEPTIVVTDNPKFKTIDRKSVV